MRHIEKKGNVILWLKSNRLNKITNTLHFQNFYAPLTSQVEALDQTTDTACSISHTPYLSWQHSDPLRLQQHIIIDITACHAAHNANHAKTDLKQGVLNRNIYSAVWGTACTSSARKIGDLFIQTNQPSAKVFAVTDGCLHAGTNVAKLYHSVLELAHTVGMVPALADQSLLSVRKFADTGYISICDDKEVNIYDGCTARILVSEITVFKGWKCPCTKLWRVQFQPCVTNLNTHTLLLNGPTGNDFLNSLYSVPLTPKMCSCLEVFDHIRPSAVEEINNVYELPIIELSIRYLHGAAGIPIKVTWLKSILKGNYLTWPFINIKNVKNFFLS